MDLTNFRTEIDADGVMLATWDVPGHSMNVITPQVMDEIASLIDAVVADTAVKDACPPAALNRPPPSPALPSPP